MSSYALASASGLRFAFWFFLAFSAAIAFMIYALLTHPALRRSQFRDWAVRKAVAAAFAFLLWVVLFAAIYFSSLAGFHTVVVDNDGVRFEYAVPNWSVGLRNTEIGDVIRRPAYRSQWRLEIYTITGGKFESAPGSYRSVKEAAEDIERRRR